jgi:RimJ/RimL family protein N-acetyltransferase
MRVKQYGITLRRVEKRDIELIRKKRNSERIKNKMIYQEYITKQMQEKWFKSIEKNTDSIYYIIIHKRNKVGLIDVKNINKTKETEAGLFLFHEKYYNTFIPVIASIILIKVGLYIVKKKDEGFIKVLKSNTNAINYNKSLGYIVIDEINNYYKMMITVPTYEKATKKILKSIEIMYGKSKFEFIFEEIDFKLDLFEPYRHYMNFLDNIIIKKIEKENYKRFILNV